MSDNIPLSVQQSCTDIIEDKDYTLDIFTRVHGYNGSKKQVYLYIRNALFNQDSNAVSFEEEQNLLGLAKVCSSDFRWENEQSQKLTAKVEMGDFCASKEIVKSKVKQMCFAEKIVFTLPISDATRMMIVAKLVDENDCPLLITDPQTIKISQMPNEGTRPATEHDWDQWQTNMNSVLR